MHPMAVHPRPVESPLGTEQRGACARDARHVLGHAEIRPVWLAPRPRSGSQLRLAREGVLCLRHSTRTGGQEVGGKAAGEDGLSLTALQVQAGVSAPDPLVEDARIEKCPLELRAPSHLERAPCARPCHCVRPCGQVGADERELASSLDRVRRPDGQPGRAGKVRSPARAPHDLRDALKCRSNCRPLSIVR